MELTLALESRDLCLIMYPSFNSFVIFGKSFNLIYVQFPLRLSVITSQKVILGQRFSKHDLGTSADVTDIFKGLWDQNSLHYLFFSLPFSQWNSLGALWHVISQQIESGSRYENPDRCLLVTRKKLKML